MLQKPLKPGLKKHNLKIFRIVTMAHTKTQNNETPTVMKFFYIHHINTNKAKQRHENIHIDKGISITTQEKCSYKSNTMKS